MDSLFFNLNDTKYKKTNIACGVKRVDISQGLLYLNANPVKKDITFKLDFPDKLVMVIAVKRGSAILASEDREHKLYSDRIYIYTLKAEKINIVFNAKSDIFVLFVADFFLHNYIDNNSNNSVNFLYNKIQNSLGLEELNSTTLDDTSIYLLKNLVALRDDEELLSLKAELLSLEILVHFLQILKCNIDGFNTQELELANSAKEILVNNYINAPTIKELAKLCQTNETKLKKAFKKVYNSTIYGFVQDLRLKRAYYLLKVEGCRVGEVSRVVGYAHQGNFAKLFKKKYKVEPSLINKIPFLAKVY